MIVKKLLLIILKKYDHGWLLDWQNKCSEQRFKRNKIKKRNVSNILENKLLKKKCPSLLEKIKKI